MAKENLGSQFGAGGSGLSDGKLGAILKEMQGINQSLVTGGAQNTKFNLAAIRAEDTLISVLNNNAGTITDVTATASISDIRATGTVTVGTVAAGDVVTVRGKAYTLVSNPTVVGVGDYSKVKVGATANECATNLAAAITAREKQIGVPVVFATAATNVVTVKAIEEGAAGNAVTLTETGTTFTVSGATLAGGSDTGGIQNSAVTNQMIVLWLNKK